MNANRPENPINGGRGLLARSPTEKPAWHRDFRNAESARQIRDTRSLFRDWPGELADVRCRDRLETIASRQ